MKKVIIIGASSGIGKQLAYHYLKEKDCLLGICARRTKLLESIQLEHKDRVIVQQMDIRNPECEEQLHLLIERMGGVDVFILNAGIGSQNKELDMEIEMNTVTTNTAGFTRLMVTAFNYMKQKKHGHIVATSSIAGTKGLALCPAYSASKRFQNQFVESLAQKSFQNKLNIKFTTILPGFIDTDLLKQKYPLTISVERAGKLMFKVIQKKKRRAYIPLRWLFIVRIWQCIPKCIWERCF